MPTRLYAYDMMHRADHLVFDIMGEVGFAQSFGMVDKGEDQVPKDIEVAVVRRTENVRDPVFVKKRMTKAASEIGKPIKRVMMEGS